MADVTTQIKDIPGEIKSMPFMAIGIGVLFLILVLIVEAYKPGLFTGPIRSALTKVGVKSA